MKLKEHTPHPCDPCGRRIPILDIEKLNHVLEKSGKITAQCPACAEDGHDRNGDHLVIYPSGKFGCIKIRDSGHRRRIKQLVGAVKARSYPPTPVVKLTIRPHPSHPDPFGDLNRKGR